MAVADGEFALKSDGTWILKADGTWALSAGCCCGSAGCGDYDYSGCDEFTVTLSGFPESDGTYGLKWNYAWEGVVRAGWAYFDYIDECGPTTRFVLIELNCVEAPVTGDPYWVIHVSLTNNCTDPVLVVEAYYQTPKTGPCPPEGATWTKTDDYYGNAGTISLP